MEVGDDFEDQLSEINFVPCVKFVKRGIANPRNIADVKNFNFAKFQIHSHAFLLFFRE
jgi:hypothetical protein